MEYTIGEFSQVARLTVKALRFYQEQGLLLPSRVDGETGYRFYDDSRLPRAEAINWLRGLDFTVQEIKDMLAGAVEEDSDLAAFLERKSEEIARKAEHYRRVKREIDLFLTHEKEISMLKLRNTIEEKTLPDTLIAGLRFRGRYEEVGAKLGVLGRMVGRTIGGAPFTLYYDPEFKEGDADMEVAFPVRKAVRAEGVSCRVLSGGRAVTLVHRGPYAEIGRTYGRLFDYLGEKNLTPSKPSRELYLKGPGMLPGNPKRYLTEVQVIVERAGARD
jgi:DNA-binding transcriptional MerR regulator/DNA gyrase inhibitor GyrI